MTPPAPRLLVIAGSYAQFRYYCDEHRLNPWTDAKYVRNVIDVRGLPEESRYVTYGTWAERWRELEGVFDYFRYRGIPSVEDEVRRDGDV